MSSHHELLEQWQRWGETIKSEGWSQRTVSRVYGVSERRGRTLAEWAQHGVPEKYKAYIRQKSGAPNERIVEEYIATHQKDRSRIAPLNIRKPGPSILVIPDAHAMPNEDLRRFTWLGRAVRELDIDAVVCIGDWADMEALNKFDKPGSRAFEGRRYTADLAAGNEALRLFHREIDGQWEGHLVFCEGNHEHRISRAVDSAVTILDDVISLDDLDFAKRGWSVYPFLTPFICEGVAFSHYFASGVMCRAVGGVNMARNLILKTLGSAVVGHSHILDYSRQARQDGSGRHFSGLSVGCYFEADHGWAGPANRMYWRGLCVLRDVNDGDYDLETWSMERIKARFGDE